MPPRLPWPLSYAAAIATVALIGGLYIRMDAKFEPTDAKFEVVQQHLSQIEVHLQKLDDKLDVLLERTGDGKRR